MRYQHYTNMPRGKDRMLQNTTVGAHSLTPSTTDSRCSSTSSINQQPRSKFSPYTLPMHDRIVRLASSPGSDKKVYTDPSMNTHITTLTPGLNFQRSPQLRDSESTVLDSDSTMVDDEFAAITDPSSSASGLDSEDTRIPKKVKIHQCYVCLKWFPRPSWLATHMNSHSEAKRRLTATQSKLGGLRSSLL
jgi:hypothetical protein